MNIPRQVHKHRHVLLVTTVSLFASVFYLSLVVALSDNPRWWAVSEDTMDYVNAATHIEQGEYYAPPALVINKVEPELFRFYRAPGFPMWLVLTRYAVWLGPIYATLLALLTYAITLRFFPVDRHHALWSGLLVGASPTVLFLTPFLLSDLPAAVLIITGVLCLTYARKSLWAIGGISFAAASLIRPTSMFYFLPSIIIASIGFWNWKRALSAVVAFGIPVLAWATFVFLNTGVFALSTQSTTALMFYGSFYGITGPKTSAIAEAHSATRENIVDDVRGAETEKQRMEIEREIIDSRIEQNRTGYIWGLIYSAAVTLVTPSKDIYGSFPSLYNKYISVRFTRAFLSCLYFVIVAIGLASLAVYGFTLDVYLYTITFVLISLALGAYAGTVIGQRIMLPTIPFTSMLLCLGLRQLAVWFKK